MAYIEDKNKGFLQNSAGENLDRPRPLYSKEALKFQKFMQENVTVIFRHEISHPPTMRCQIGNAEYIVSGRISPNARETAEQKMRRLILNAKIDN